MTHRLLDDTLLVRGGGFVIASAGGVLDRRRGWLVAVRPAAGDANDRRTREHGRARQPTDGERSRRRLCGERDAAERARGFVGDVTATSGTWREVAIDHARSVRRIQSAVQLAIDGSYRPAP
jgi:hypothetical protein